VSAVERARELAESLLYPSAAATDAAPLVPESHLDALAGAGLYGLLGPARYGGLEASGPERADVIEALASGCLATTFIWLQHHSAVRTLAEHGSDGLRERLLGALCRGEQRSGVAYSGLRRPGPPLLSAHRTPGGYVLDGSAPWVTGWGRIDILHVAAREQSGQVVWLLLEDLADPAITHEHLRLSAVGGSGTVTLRFDGLVVPRDQVSFVESFEAFSHRDAAGLAPNGALSLGSARRSLALRGPSPLDEALSAARRELATAASAELPRARAQASALALQAAAALVVSGGGRSILAGTDGERLMREATFLLVFGQTPAIRAAQLDLYDVATS
jgi:alkylation response protein AidB-like acyl-CoA dehydrogenase